MDRFLSLQNDRVLETAGQKSCFKFLKIALKIKCSLQFTTTEQKLTKV